MILQHPLHPIELLSVDWYNKTLPRRKIGGMQRQGVTEVGRYSPCELREAVDVDTLGDGLLCEFLLLVLEITFISFSGGGEYVWFSRAVSKHSNLVGLQFNILLSP
jgi:hypothetical protein